MTEQSHNFKKTIFYTNLKWCAYSFDKINTAILASEIENKDEVRKLVAQYHAPSIDETKKIIVHDFSSIDGSIKLLLATEAYGMGTDAPDVRRIIHFGPPNSLETYMQEIGRAGRDGLPSEACLFYNKNGIGRNVTNLTTEMRSFCTLDTCRREYLACQFGFLHEPFAVPHFCCDICELSCLCDQCVASSLDSVFLHDTPAEESENTSSNPHSKELQSVLCQYFDAENATIDAPVRTLLTGLTQELASRIAVKHEHIVSLEDLYRLKDCNQLNKNYVENIYGVIHQFRSSL